MAVTDTTILSHFASVRSDTGVNSVNVPDTDLLIAYNRARRKIINRIRTINRDYYYTEWTDNLVKDQIEYTIPKYRTYVVNSITYVVPKCSEVIQVAVKTWQATGFTPLAPTSIRNPYDIEGMRQYWSGYTVIDNSIFIFPVASENITGWIKIYGIYEPPDLQESSTASELAIPEENHELLIQETKVHVCEARQLTEKLNFARAESERLWNVYRDNFIRQRWPYINQEPNYSWLY